MKSTKILIAIATVIPLTVNAEENNNYLSLTEQYKKKDIAMTVEVGTFLFSHNSLQGKSKYDTQKQQTTSLLGASQNLSIGVDIKGIQFSIEASHQKVKPGDDESDITTTYGFGLSMDVPLMSTSFTPIVSVGAGIVGINWKNNNPDFKYEIDEVAYNFMIGFGARYYVDDHTFFKTQLTYQRYTFDTTLNVPATYYSDEEKVKVDFKNQNFGLTFGIGYRF